MAAIQATELYLNALMLSRGLSSAKIRALQHNMAARALFARTSGIDLRERTITHLIDLSVRREYLMSRYGADFSDVGSQLNCLAATLHDVGEKVSRTIRKEAVTK